MSAERNEIPDLITVVSIGLVAYAFSNILHEGVGHGGACIALGGKPMVLSSLHFECGEEAMSRGAQRLVSAAGTIVNFVTGAISFVAYRQTAALRRPHLAYFLWLFTTLNLLMAAGYFLFSGLGNIGDWAAVMRDTLPAAVWRPGLALLGAVLYYVLARLSCGWLQPLVGNDELMMRRAKRLTIPPYIAGGLLYCISGLFNPVGPILIAISAAAASFGGASGLLWLTEFLRRRERVDKGPAILLLRSYPWIISAALVSIAFVAILGAGIRF
jgi:hypothetical protein